MTVSVNGFNPKCTFNLVNGFLGRVHILSSMYLFDHMNMKNNELYITNSVALLVCLYFIQFVQICEYVQICLGLHPQIRTSL
jgi:hypothetical protein